jgi:hypothetical protein
MSFMYPEGILYNYSPYSESHETIYDSRENDFSTSSDSAIVLNHVDFTSPSSKIFEKYHEIPKPSLAELERFKNHKIFEQSNERTSEPTLSDNESWLSEHSENQLRIDDLDQTSLKEISALARMLVNLFDSVILMSTSSAQEDDGGTEQFNNTQTSTSISSEDKQAENTNSKKRKRDNSQDTSDSGNAEDVCKKAKQLRTGQKKRYHFACPFAKKNPKKFRTCYKHILTRIADVKQHIRRSHYFPMYCPTCLQTFDNAEGRDDHIVARTCQTIPGYQKEGITETQKEQLRKKVPPKLDEQEQWFTVFDILFPEYHPRPLSPYVDTELAEEQLAFQDYASGFGPQVILRHLQENGITLHTEYPEGALSVFTEVVVARGLLEIFDRWSLRTSSTPSNSNPSEIDSSNTTFVDEQLQAYQSSHRYGRSEAENAEEQPSPTPQQQSSAGDETILLENDSVVADEEIINIPVISMQPTISDDPGLFELISDEFLQQLVAN